MNKDKIELLLATSLFLNSCVPIEKASPVLAAPLEPTTTLPQPASEPTVEIPIEFPVEKEMVEPMAVPDFIYFSQYNQWTNIQARRGLKVSDVSCGVIVGAMVTRTDPNTYWEYLVEYYKENHMDTVLLEGGTDIDDHRKVLEKLGYTVTPIEGSVDEIKTKIARYTVRGIPVWISGEFFFDNAWRSHQAMAVGIDANGNIIFNDPAQGEAISIPDKYLDQKNRDEDGDNAWRVYAVE